MKKNFLIVICAIFVNIINAQSFYNISTNNHTVGGSLSLLDSITFSNDGQDAIIHYGGDNFIYPINEVNKISVNSNSEISISYTVDGVYFNNPYAYDGVSITTNNGHVNINTEKSRKYNIYLTGTSSEGSINLSGKGEYDIFIQNLNLSNSAGPAITVNAGCSITELYDKSCSLTGSTGICTGGDLTVKGENLSIYGRDEFGIVCSNLQSFGVKLLEGKLGSVYSNSSSFFGTNFILGYIISQNIVISPACSMFYLTKNTSYLNIGNCVAGVLYPQKGELNTILDNKNNPIFSFLPNYNDSLQLIMSIRDSCGNYCLKYSKNYIYEKGGNISDPALAMTGDLATINVGGTYSHGNQISVFTTDTTTNKRAIKILGKTDTKSYIWDLLSSDRDYSDFCSYIESVGLKDKIISSKCITVFAPTNEALKNQNITKYNSLSYAISNHLTLSSGAEQNYLTMLSGRKYYYNNDTIGNSNVLTTTTTPQGSICRLNEYIPSFSLVDAINNTNETDSLRKFIAGYIYSTDSIRTFSGNKNVPTNKAWEKAYNSLNTFSYLNVIKNPIDYIIYQNLKLNKKADTRCDNGSFNLIDDIDISKYFAEKDYECEDTSLINNVISGSPHVIKLANKNNEITGDISGESYIELRPVSSSINPSITYNLENVMSGTYNLYCIIVPANVISDSVDNILPNKIKISVTYYKQIGAQIFSGTEYLNHDNSFTFITDSNKIDTISSEITFPNSTIYTKYNPQIKISSYVLSKETSIYDRIIRIDKIYLVPKRE